LSSRTLDRHLGALSPGAHDLRDAGLNPFIGDELPLYPHQGAIKMHPGVKDELACRGFVCRTLHRLGLNVETIKPNGRPAVGIGWVPPEHAD